MQGGNALVEERVDRLGRTRNEPRCLEIVLQRDLLIFRDLQNDDSRATMRLADDRLVLSEGGGGGGGRGRGRAGGGGGGGRGRGGGAGAGVPRAPPRGGSKATGERGGKGAGRPGPRAGEGPRRATCRSSGGARGGRRF